MSFTSSPVPVPISSLVFFWLRPLSCLRFWLRPFLSCLRFWLRPSGSRFWLRPSCRAPWLCFGCCLPGLPGLPGFGFGLLVPVLFPVLASAFLSCFLFVFWLSSSWSCPPWYCLPGCVSLSRLPGLGFGLLVLALSLFCFFGSSLLFFVSSGISGFGSLSCLLPLFFLVFLCFDSFCFFCFSSPILLTPLSASGAFLGSQELAS